MKLETSKPVIENFCDNPTICIIPCAADKLDHSAAAQDLYTSSNFQNTLAAAKIHFDKVLILSAKYGLLELDQVVETYDVQIGKGHAEEVTEETIREQLADLVEFYHDGGQIYTLLPKAYRAAINSILRDEYVFAEDIYEAAPGIGYQRGVCSSMKILTPEVCKQIAA